jgi:hypothetical protein
MTTALRRHLVAIDRPVRPVRVEGNGRAVVSQAGTVLLVETVRKTGLDRGLWRTLSKTRFLIFGSAGQTRWSGGRALIASSAERSSAGEIPTDPQQGSGCARCGSPS